MDDGKKGGGSVVNLRSRGTRGTKDVNLLEDARDEYEQVKDFF